MDLFKDTYYKNDVENKINYYDFLYNNNTSFPGVYSIKNNTSGGTIITKSNNVLIIKNTNIDNVHVINSTTGEYMQEFKIARHIKKFILDQVSP